jgi:transposase
MPHPADFPSICVLLQENSCQKPMTVPGIGPAISTAMVAAIGKCEAFQRGRDFRCPARLDPSTILDWGRLILGRLSKHGSKGSTFCP